MDNILNLKNNLLLSAQRALLGHIYPSIRAIAVGFNELDKLTIKMYLDRKPVKDDYEILSEISGEILADIQVKKVEELCEYSASDLYLGDLDVFVYVRKE